MPVPGEGRSLAVSVRSTQAVAVAGCAMHSRCANFSLAPAGPFSALVSTAFHSTRITNAPELLYQVVNPLCIDTVGLCLHVLPPLFPLAVSFRSPSIFQSCKSSPSQS